MINLTNLTLELHLLVFISITILALLIGFFIGRLEMSKLKKRALTAENEMLHSNNEVLKYAEINKQLTETLEKAKIPLPTITKHKEEEILRSIPFGKIG